MSRPTNTWASPTTQDDSFETQNLAEQTTDQITTLTTDQMTRNLDAAWVESNA